MAWRNRIVGTMKASGFRKMSMEGEDDYDMPLLVQTTSSLATTPSPKSKNLGFKVKGFGKNSKNSNSIGLNSNIAAVPDEVEALSFREEIIQMESSLKRTSNNTSPVSIMEETSFVAQFDPASVETEEGEEKGELATVFDDETSNDGSILTGSKDKDTDEEDSDEDKEQTSSLAPPSLVDTNEFEEEQKRQQIPRALSSKSIAKSSVDNSNTRRSNRTRNTDNSTTRRSSRTYIDEEADAATWKADEIDAFVDVDDFGNSSGQSSEPAMEISGINLLTERDSYLGELQEISHLMTFNALVLIQKQKDWIEGSLTATSSANKGSSNMIMMELSNLERKIKLLMDNKEWPNEREREKQKIDPLTPSKAFFKAMALIDKSIEQFHRGYLKYMSNTGEENHELKARVNELLVLNASLQEEAARSQQKTETIRNLQKERDDLTRKVDRADEKLSSLLPSDDNDRRNSTGSSGKKKDSKFHSVRSYIHRLEAERDKNLAEIESLKLVGKNIPIDASHEDGEDEDEEESLGEKCDENQLQEEKKTSSLDLSIITENSDDDSKENEDTDVLLDDLGSKWRSLQENENAMTLVANKEKQVDRLSKTVTDQETCLDSLRSECKLMRMQLLQLETNRNEFKSQCEMKDSALAISQDRIATLEEEVLRTQLECATYEEDYQAMKESFDSQKLAAKQGIFQSEDEVKAQFEQIRMEFNQKLERKDEELNEIREDRERLVRDLKASMKEVETERDNLRAELTKKNAAKPVLPPPIPPIFEEEKKESEENVIVVASPIEEKEGIDFEQMQSRFAEKAAKQANTIAQLTEQNEIKDEQLKALHDMVEMLLGHKAEQRSEDNNGKWGQRISKFKLMSQQRATDLMNRSRHGGSIHGSRHGGSIHGSRHGGSIHVVDDAMEEYSNR
mmetsp:Transcript_10333/g.30231  ORF Transcript_10333/g.30231 Transcript_10333/m.30231 type:complete len:908 (-) Transcript_10333:308-3031(-)